MKRGNAFFLDNHNSNVISKFQDGSSLNGHGRQFDRQTGVTKNLVNFCLYFLRLNVDLCAKRINIPTSFATSQITPSIYRKA